MFSGDTSLGYKNPKIDEVRAAFLVETDPKKQQAQYDEMNKIFYENPPSLNFFQFQPPRAIRDNVKGYCLDCLFPILHNVWLD
jgi:ABC-type transport system substrate-binding protein